MLTRLVRINKRNIEYWSNKPGPTIVIEYHIERGIGNATLGEREECSCFIYTFHILKALPTCCRK